MGRPRKQLTKDEIAQVETDAAFGLTLEQIAERMGIGESTLRRRMRDDERVLTAHRKGKARVTKKVAGQLVRQALNGNIKAMMFYLERQAGWRREQRTELTGTAGGPVQYESSDEIDVSRLSDEEAEELYRLVAKARGAGE